MMAILAECPICRKIQSNSNLACSCGKDLIKAKSSRRVRYFVHYRDSNGRQRKELVGFSRSKARKKEAECLAEKDNIAPDPKMTFDMKISRRANINIYSITSLFEICDEIIPVLL
jgi:hypothetical protein